MDGFRLTLGWFMVVVGVGSIIVGVVTFTRHEVLPAPLRGFVEWRRWGWTGGRPAPRGLRHVSRDRVRVSVVLD